MSSTTKIGCVNDLDSKLGQLTFADLHIHSKYSRATSPQMDVTSLHYWAKRKGIGLMGTGDFTHPNYFQELKEKLEPDETGFYKVKGQNRDVLFLPTAVNYTLLVETHGRASLRSVQIDDCLW